MKTMNCQQLGGACEKEFTANTFDEMAALSLEHCKEMMEKEDPDHLKAMDKMTELMTNPRAMGEWFNNKRKEFETL
jgi:hypothetical protein